jgi:hypothetical protein
MNEKFILGLTNLYLKSTCYKFYINKYKFSHLKKLYILSFLSCVLKTLAFVFILKNFFEK